MINIETTKIFHNNITNETFHSFDELTSTYIEQMKENSYLPNFIIWDSESTSDLFPYTNYGYYDFEINSGKDKNEMKFDIHGMIWDGSMI